MAKFASIRRIRLEEPGKVEATPPQLSTVEHNERIVDDVLKHNAILLTADNNMKAYAISKSIFTIFA